MYDPSGSHQGQVTMNDTTAISGSIARNGERLEARLVREIEHDPESVWHMLTAPDALVNWLAPATVEPRTGGAIQLAFEDSGTAIYSTIRQFDPPRLLEYSWSSGPDSERPMRWQLTPTDGGTHLQLTVQIPANEDIAKAAAGWDAHLEMLLAALEGVPIRFPVDLFLAARSEYQEQLVG